MSPVSMLAPTETHFSTFIEALRSAPTAPGLSYNFPVFFVFLQRTADAKYAADRLAREVSKCGPESLKLAFPLIVLSTELIEKLEPYQRS
jgi:elongation factor 3